MSISSDGIICYGIDLGEDLYGLPWYDEEDDEREMEDWWLDECGYKPLYDLYDEDGEYSETYTKERSDEHYAHKRKFELEHPCPVDLVFHCSYEYAMYILAVKDSKLSASRGGAVTFDVDYIKKYEAEKETLLGFCKKYNIEVPEEGPSWLLCSVYG